MTNTYEVLAPVLGTATKSFSPPSAPQKLLWAGTMAGRGGGKRSQIPAQSHGEARESALILVK